MSHAQAIPTHVKSEFEFNVEMLLSSIFNNIESNLWLSEEEKVFFNLLDRASNAGEHGAVFKAFGRILIDE